jgi:uncharacterized membrane protein
MLIRLITAIYPKLLEAAIWLAIAFAAVAGYHFTVPVMSAAGLEFSSEFAGGVFGAIVLSAITFLVIAVVTGPIATLMDIRQAVRRIEARLDRAEDVGYSPPAERSDPPID